LSSTIKSSLAGAIEISLNKVLPFDPDYINKLASINNKVINICLLDWQLQLFFLPQEYSFLVLSSYQGESDVKLEGNSWDFFSLGIHQISNKDGPELQSNIRFEGDISTGQKFETLFKSLNIDWEEILATSTDDFFAHHATRAVKKANRWFSDFFQSSQENFSEYIREEVRITPSKIEVMNFYDDLKELEAKAERLLQRSQQFTNQSNH